MRVVNNYDQTEISGFKFEVGPEEDKGQLFYNLKMQNPIEKRVKLMKNDILVGFINVKAHWVYNKHEYMKDL